MATLPNAAAFFFFFLVLHLLLYGRLTAATWCVARSDAAEDALQKALDYACGAGADCTPIQETSPCFLPDTVQAHASYAFNSYYMRASMALGSCDFAGSATIAKTDPSYGSCVYPASPSNTGQTTSISPSPQNATASDGNETAIDGNRGALTPTDMAPTLANPPSSEAFIGFSISRLLFMSMMLIVFLFVFQPMDVIFVA